MYANYLWRHLYKPAIQETQVPSLDWEDPLENEKLPTPVFWPREFHELYSPWGSKESDTTEKLSLSQDEDGLCSSYTRLLVLCEFLRRERKVWSESLDLEAALKGR